MSLPVFAGDTRPNIIVFYTDDHGYADLSCQGVLDDIKTPNVDALAQSGVLARHGYSTAPQCVPSRAGLLIGKFQSRFGVESNGKSLDGFNRELTIAERLQAVGYVTAQFGNGILGPDRKSPATGSNTCSTRTLNVPLRPTSRSTAKTARCRVCHQRCIMSTDAAKLPLR